MSTDDRLTMALFAKELADRERPADFEIRTAQFLNRWVLPHHREDASRELDELIALMRAELG